jgi:hypothetical protein
VNGSFDNKYFGTTKTNLGWFEFRDSRFRSWFDLDRMGLSIRIVFRFFGSINEIGHWLSWYKRISDSMDVGMGSFCSQFLFIISELSHESGNYYYFCICL